MKPVLTQTFVTLGVVFLIVIAIGIYFLIADPMNIKPLIFGSDSAVTKNDAANESTLSSGFQLSEAQKQALVGIGIDPAQVPSSINASQEACFVSTLGESRVAEIKAGAVPNAIEFMKAKACI